jgi:hypothetical protein
VCPLSPFFVFRAAITTPHFSPGTMLRVCLAVAQRLPLLRPASLRLSGLPCSAPLLRSFNPPQSQTHHHHIGCPLRHFTSQAAAAAVIEAPVVQKRTRKQTKQPPEQTQQRVEQISQVREKSATRRTCDQLDVLSCLFVAIDLHCSNSARPMQVTMAQALPQL